MSLFSVFDPVVISGNSKNWMVLVFLLLMLMGSFFLVESKVSVSFKNISLLLGKMFEEISFPYSYGIMMISMVLFLLVMLMNLLGLFPYVFTASAHPVISFSLGMVMWVSLFLMGWMKNFSKSSAHLVSEGCPMILSPFMVMIEVISHLIRPITLSIRLAANMMAGHLIIGLISSISEISFFGFFMSLFMQILLLVLEWGVCLIQGFVFSVLVMMYMLDFY